MSEPERKSDPILSQARLCPFCLSGNLKWSAEVGRIFGVCVACEDCGASGPMALATDHPEPQRMEVAVVLWNGRKLK